MSTLRRTQVAIVGSGPSGLLLAQLLRRAGIDTVLLERRSREYVLARVRAGVLEQTSVEILRRAGVAARLDREGLVHHVLDCEFVAGCDGFHGVCRRSIPAAALTTHERVYPFAFAGRVLGHGFA